jgi:hypothetical protein
VRTLGLILTAAVLILIASVAGLVPGSPNTRTLTEPGSGPVPEGGSICNTITTNATLQGWARDYYPNSTISPSESVAVSEVAQDWGSVCTSSVFGITFEQGVGPAFGVRVYEGDENWSPTHVLSASLFVEFTLSWNASCPAGPGCPGGYSCNFQDRWTGNLTTNSLVGPVERALSTRVAGCTFALTNASVVFAVDAFYPNESLHPNRSEAQQVAQTVWGEICTSLPFYQNYSAHAEPSVTLGESTGNAPCPGGPNSSSCSPATGYAALELTFDLGWQGACPAGGPQVVTANCSFDADWTANLSSGSWGGPYISVVGNDGTPTGLGNLTYPLGVPGPGSTSPLALGAVLGAAVVMFGGLLLLETGRAPRRPPPPSSHGPSG